VLDPSIGVEDAEVRMSHHHPLPLGVFVDRARDGEARVPSQEPTNGVDRLVRA
jgi:hypothetical protein